MIDVSSIQAFFLQYAAMKKVVAAQAAEAYAQQGLGSAQTKFLRHLGKCAAPISQATLARETDSDEALTGRVLRTLILRGWVKRARSTEDRREYVLELTAAGRKMEKRIDALRDGMAKKLAEALDERDLKDFERIAKKVLTALK